MNLFLTLTFISTVYGGHVNTTLWEEDREDCGRSKFDRKNLKVENNGNSALAGQFPWMARIGNIHPQTRQKHFFCGGSLISKHYVISAAHCGTSGQFVRLGDYSGDSNKNACDECGNCALPPQDIKIKRHIYADHCRMSNVNDITILQLEEKAIFNDYVQPICLPTEQVIRSDIMKEPLFLSGWGVTYSGFGRTSNSTPSKDLMFLKASVLNPEECGKVYTRNLDSSQHCVGYPEVDDPCVGDSGGPLIKYIKEGKIKRAYLIGVASHDLMKCSSGDKGPVVYTDVSSYSKWIVATIKPTPGAGRYHRPIQH